MPFDNLGFEHRYIVEEAAVAHPDFVFLCNRQPLAAGILTFSRASNIDDRMSIRVATERGPMWTGSCESGPEGLTGLFATPNSDVLCAVFNGLGFWIPTLYPSHYELICSLPIKQVLRVPDMDVMVFSDFICIAGYGPSGFLWKTHRLSWDGVNITRIHGKIIEGMAWDAPREIEVPFSVEASTGLVIGGSSPETYIVRNRGEQDGAQGGKDA